MRPFASSLLAAALAGPRTAMACRVAVEMDIRDVLLADVVVIGRIHDYRIAFDPEDRERYGAVREAVVESLGDDIPPEVREALLSGGFISDYARFGIQADRVLVGRK